MPKKVSIKKQIIPVKYRKKIWMFLLIVFIYCVILAILEGTVEHYVGTRQLIFGLYISWDGFFIALFSFGIGIIFMVIFKENIKKWV